MQDRYSYSPEEILAWSAVRPLKDLTAAEFSALGGNALVYIRALKGNQVSKLLADPEIIGDQTLHMVISADGTPLLVTDDPERLAEWLEETNFGVICLH